MENLSPQSNSDGLAVSGEQFSIAHFP
jgi:hypothetical protein